MWFTRLFGRDSSLILPQPCLGCAARIAHIEDLQALIRSEREGNAMLQAILIDRHTPVAQPVAEAEGEMKPLRQISTMRQLRQQAEAREREKFPKARDDYWERVQKQYDRAGKLPVEEKKVEPGA